MLRAFEARRRAGAVVGAGRPNCTARRACDRRTSRIGRIDVDVVALNLGFQPETGLARALGADHRFVDAGLGHLATETDDDGRTSVSGVFAIGDGAFTRRIARRDGARPARPGLAAARDLGLNAPDEPATRAALARALAFQDALWRMFRAPPTAGARLTQPSSAAARR